MKKILRLALAAILFAAGTVSARLPEPASMPQDIKGTSPHKPEAAVYYLTELVKEGKMTAEEAERTEVYQILSPSVLMSLSSACCISPVMELFPPALFSVHSTAISSPT